MKTPVISIRLDPALDERIQRAIDDGRFATRTEAIVHALRREFGGGPA